MKLALELAAGCAILIAAPASAQVLGGGGGIGGSLGGAGGQLGGTIGNVNQSTRGTADGAAGADVDRRSGRARARAGGNGAIGSHTGTRIGQLNRSAGASANADIGAQAVGTDAVRGTVGYARNTTRGTIDSARGTTRGTVGSASANANTGGSFQGGPANLAAAGSAAASSGAAIPVSPSMIVRDTSGRVIGRVQSLRARANGMVDNVIVRVGDRLASLPDENFSASGSVLVSAMGQADISRMSRSQSAQPQQSSAPTRQRANGRPQEVDKQ